jgi:ribosomal-protein-alanine N-acetyltransferase
MILFRNACKTDLFQIARLEQDIFSDAWTENAIEETFCQKQAFISVADVDGEVVGYCIIYHVLDEGEMVRIAIDQKVRRQGIGKELLTYTSKVCQEKGVSRILLEVRMSNASARGFYTNYGFGEDGIRKNFYDNPKEDAVLMSKTLL